MNKSIKVDKQLIAKLTKLANLPLTDAQKSKLPAELTDILKYASKIADTNTKNTEETAQVTGLTNVMREDRLDRKRGLSQKQALQNTKNIFNNYFVVPALIDHES